MSTTPEDPFARQSGDNQGQQPQAWGEAPPPPAAPQNGQPQYAQPQYDQSQYPQHYGAPAGARPGTEKNWMGITSLVLSLVGLFTWVTAIGGIILGHMGRNAAKKGQADNAGLSLAGLIIGYVITILGVVAIIAMIAFFGWIATECGGDNPSTWCTE